MYRYVPVLLLMICFWIPRLCFSEDTSPHQLESIVVTATRAQSKVKEVPANISIITKEQIEEKGARSLTDVFRDEQGIFTRDLLGNPKFSAIDIRGFGETASQNSLFLIDGRRVNDIDISTVDLMQVPIEMIERIEIYRGPGSVLYGDNAIGGVVNIILKKGEGKPSIVAGLNTGSYDLYNPYLGALGRQGRLSYNILTSSYDTTGYRHNNDLHAKDLFGSFSYEFPRALQMIVKAGHHRDNYGLAGPLSAVELHTGIFDRKDSAKPFEEGNTEDNFIDLEAIVKPTDTFHVSLGAAYRKRHTSFHFDLSGMPWDSMRRFETMSLTPKIAVKEDIFSLKNTLVAGIDYYYSPSRSNDSGTGTSSDTNINKTEYGFYINDEIFLRKDLVFSAGYRYAKVRYDFDYTDNTGTLAPINDFVKKDKDAFRVGLNYIIPDKGNVFVNFATGFRFPATDEYFNPFAAPPINDGLEPHTAKELDLGIRYNFTKSIGASLTGFLGHHKNEIYFNPLTFQNSNYGKTKRQGIETTFYWIILPGLRFDMGYTYMDAQFDGDDLSGNRIPMVPQNKLNGSVSWAINDLTLTFSSLYMGDRYLTSDVRNVYPALGGFTVYDFMAAYTWKGFKITGAVKNIFDKQYSDYGVVVNTTSMRYFYPSPERNYLLGVHYTYQF
ncbi:MAG: TonB-dependent receptor [Syntrophorhabdaceae bacterium]